MRFTTLFFVLVLFFTGLGESAEKFCKINADPVNQNKKLSKGEYVDFLPIGTVVTMVTGSSKKVTCVLSTSEGVAIGENGIPKWIIRCGNPLIAVKLPVVRLSNFDKAMLMKPYQSARIIQVSECGQGTECWARAQQFKFNFNVGVGAQWLHHTGLPDYNHNVSYNQNQNATGGQGGQGGQGGTGGIGYGGQSTTTTAQPANNTNGGGGPINPGDPPSGGGPINPGDPPSGGGPISPGD